MGFFLNCYIFIFGKFLLHIHQINFNDFVYKIKLLRHKCVFQHVPYLIEEHDGKDRVIQASSGTVMNTVKRG